MEIQENVNPTQIGGLDAQDGIQKTYVDGEVLEIIPLGGGREVGRSCILVRFKGKLIMVSLKFLESVFIV